jgi:hypothetical protein
MKNYESVLRKQQLMQRQFRNVASGAQEKQWAQRETRIGS